MTAIAQVIKTSTDWRTATADLIAHYMENGDCFSSGEIAKEIRTHRPDLKFSVLTMGEYVRDQFYTDAMGQYNDGAGNLVYPVMVPRTTQGTGRTPAGKEVFVYGPDSASCLLHDFEVDIPAPPGVATNQGGNGGGYPTSVQTQPKNPQSGYPTSVQTQPKNPLPPQSGTVQSQGVSIQGRAPAKTLKAKVHSDRRLCVTREAFEAFVHASGRTLRGGDPVYIELDGNKAVVTLDPANGSAPYSLSTHRGRILFPTRHLNPGDSYKVNVNPSCLTVDLSAPL